MTNNENDATMLCHLFNTATTKCEYDKTQPNGWVSRFNQKNMKQARFVCLNKSLTFCIGLLWTRQLSKGGSSIL